RRQGRVVLGLYAEPADGGVDGLRSKRSARLDRRAGFAAGLDGIYESGDGVAPGAGFYRAAGNRRSERRSDYRLPRDAILSADDGGCVSAGDGANSELPVSYVTDVVDGRGPQGTRRAESGSRPQRLG